MINRKKVYISGMGIFSPFGYGIDVFGEALKRGDTAIDYWSSQKERTPPLQLGARIGPYDFKEEINKLSLKDKELESHSKKLVRRSNLTIESLVLAALEAWKMAELIEKPVEDIKKGLVVAGNNTFQNYTYETIKKYGEQTEYVTPSYALQFMDTNSVGILSEIFSIRNEGFSAGNASASGNAAIIKGIQMIQSGITELCLVGGGATDLSPMEWAAFTNLNALGGKTDFGDPKLACRPFDRRHEGFILGQAGACLILESEESIVSRGAKKLAELNAGAILLDGNSLSNPSLQGEIAVMKRVLELAELSSEKIDYINAHGTSTPLGDETELMAVNEVFKDHLKSNFINSTKGITGHCFYTAGIVEAIASIIQIREGFVHGNRNLEEPVGLKEYLIGESSVKKEIKHAISNSFGFGGINTSIVISKG